MDWGASHTPSLTSVFRKSAKSKTASTMKEATIKQKKRLPSFRFQDTQDCLGNRQPLAADGRKEDLGVGVTQVSGHHLNSQRCHHFLHLLLVSGLRKTKENITDTVAHTHQKSMYLCGTVCIKEAQPTHTHTHTPSGHHSVV